MNARGRSHGSSWIRITQKDEQPLFPASSHTKRTRVLPPGRVFWQWPLLARRSPSTRRRAGSDDATRAGICQIRVAREIRRTGVVAHRLRVRWVVVYVEQVGDGHAPLWENGIPLFRLVGTRARFSKERMAPPAWVWGDERVADWTDSPTPPRNAERAPPRDGIGSSASPPQISRGGTEPPRAEAAASQASTHHSLVSTRRQVDLPGSLPAEVERRAFLCAVLLDPVNVEPNAKQENPLFFFLVFSWCLHHRSDPS